MASHIKHQEADAPVHALARSTGESSVGTVLTATGEQRGASRSDVGAVRKNIREIQRDFASKHIADSRSAEKIIGYDEHGLPA